MGSALPSGERAAGRADDFVSSQKALPVSGEKTLSTHTVDPRQAFAKSDAAEKPMELESLLANSLGNFRNGCETILESSKIKAGTAHKNGQPSLPSRHRDLIQGQRTPVSNGAALGGIEKAIEAMRCSLFGGDVRTRRQDPEITIDLLAVGIDDGPAKGVCHL
jgi:hypothetical protein